MDGTACALHYRNSSWYVGTTFSFIKGVANRSVASKSNAQNGSRELIGIDINLKAPPKNLYYRQKL